MITCTDNFKTAIKADMRECVAKVVLNYSTPLTLTDEKIQKIEVTSKGDIVLGGVQNDDLTLVLMKNAISDEQFNQEIDVEIKIGCKLSDSTYEYISIGTFEADGWNKNDKSGIVSISLTSKINSNAHIPKNIISSNDTISSYASKFINLVYGKTLTIDTNITSQAIGKSWLFYEDVVEQLTKFGEACNGLFRYVNGFELVPYKTSTSKDTIKMGSNEAILEVSRLSDYSKDKKEISILRSTFNKSELSQLVTTNVDVKNGEGEWVEVETGCPTEIHHVIVGNIYGQLADIVNGIVTCQIEVDGVYTQGSYKVPVSVFGYKVQSQLLDKKTVTDGSVTYIQNPYIQSQANITALSKAIYEGIRYKVKYRGNPCYQVGDIINVDGIGNILMYSHQLDYNGGLTGYLEGVLV